MEDADGRVTKLDYDELNRLFRTTRDPDGLNLTTTTTDFDEDGRPERILEANGEVTVQTWDELGRLSTRTHEPPASGWTAPWAYTTEERYGYDPNSNLERVREFDARTGGGGPPERLTTRGYDKLDRQTSETVTLQDETTSSVTTEYFRDGRVKSVTDPRGVTSHTYDGQGREETVTTSGGVTRKTYYLDGLVKDITFPNGTKRAHGYDKADRLLSIVTTKDEAPVASTAYTYDPNGNRLTQVQTNGGSERRA
jgi:YD repeat-containing protein